MNKEWSELNKKMQLLLRKKDITGIIKMPFTRHLIMHIEAMMRIAGKIGIEILQHKKADDFSSALLVLYR